jgi:hypothetical protein
MGAGSAPVLAEDTKPSAEERLLEIMKQKGFITNEEYTELKGISDEMRQEDESEKAVLEREIDRYVQEAQAAKSGGDMATGFQMGYKDGFFAKSADGNFSMTIGGYVQVRYQYTNFDETGFNDAVSDVGSVFGLGAEGSDALVSSYLKAGGHPTGPDRNEIDIRRGRFFVSGNVIDQYTHYFMQIETGDSPDDAGGNANVSLRDYFIDYTRFDPFNLKIGQFKVPFGRQELTSASRLLFQDRSVATTFFTPARNGGAGIQAYGSLGGDTKDLFEYYGGIFNGEGQNNSNLAGTGLINDGPGLMYAGRVAVNPLGTYGYNEPDTDSLTNQSENLRATIGGNIVWHPDDALPGGFDVDTTIVGGDVGAKWMGVSVQGEYFHSHTDPMLSGTKSFDFDGWYGQAGWIIPQTNFEVAGRYGQLLDSDGVLTLDKDSTLNEWSIGANYYFKAHRAKLQADWTRFTSNVDKITDVENDVFRIQVQLMF